MEEQHLVVGEERGEGGAGARRLPRPGRRAGVFVHQ